MTANIAAVVVNLLCLIFTADVWRRLRGAATGPDRAKAGGFLAAALSAGMLNGFALSLDSVQEHFPFARPVMVLSMLALLVAAGFGGPGRRLLGGVTLDMLLPVYLWRIVFGALLLLLGLLGALPPAFFWSAAIGDMLVGVWALSMLPRLERVSQAELFAWNIAGLADLIHVVALGALHLSDFYSDNPELMRPSLLPLFGVPLFLAMHVHQFRIIATRAR